MGLMMCEGKYVGRERIAEIATPEATETWHPVPHMDVIDAVTEEIMRRNWQIVEEQFGLARFDQRMFGVIKVNRSNSPEWTRCIGIRNSHDKSVSVGLSAGICVRVCSNLAFGGETVIKRRHTSRIELSVLLDTTFDALEEQFSTLEFHCDILKGCGIRDDEARARLVRMAEKKYINSSDIVPIFNEYKHPRHDQFASATEWSLLNACTEHAKKYSPGRADVFYRGLTRMFGLDGSTPEYY